MIPSDTERAALLKRLLSEPQLVADEELVLARLHGIVSEGADFGTLLRVNDRSFFRALDRIPEARRRDLSHGWWARVCVPLFRELEGAKPKTWTDEHERN